MQKRLAPVISGLNAGSLRIQSPMRLDVECYSGRIGDERPVRFRLDDNEYVVEEVLDQWYGPDDIFFKIRADDSNTYILKHQSEPNGLWELVSFRRSV